MSQCDGCRRGLRLDNGLHYEAGHLYMACTATRYVPDDAWLCPCGATNHKVRTWCWECKRNRPGRSTA